MELEYEGDPEFLTGGIETLLETMGGLAGKVREENLLTSSMPDSQSAIHTDTVAGLGTSTGSAQLTLSTNTIAARIGGKSGTALVICALAHLDLVQGKGSSSRAEILAEMKNAKQYYKTTMSKNLTSIINSLLTTQRIIEGAKEHYSLSATERSKIEAQIA